MTATKRTFSGPQRHAPLSLVTAEDFDAYMGAEVTLTMISDRVVCHPSCVSRLFKRWRETGIPIDRFNSKLVTADAVSKPGAFALPKTERNTL